MTIYYLDSSATAGVDDGSSWTDAFLTLAEFLVVAIVGDVCFVDDGHTEELAADTTFTLPGVSLIVVDKATGNLSTMGTSAWIGNSTTNRTIQLSGATKNFFYGLTFRIGGVGIDNLYIGYTDGAHYELSNCYLWCGTTNTSSAIHLGVANANNGQAYVSVKNCTFRFGSTSQKIYVNQQVDIIGGSVSASGSIPTTLFYLGNLQDGVPILNASGMDLSNISGTLIADSTGAPSKSTFSNCKLHASVTILATQTVVNKSGADVFLYNCASGDTHYNFGHYDAFGSTVAVSAIYADDGALYDGTNHVTWKITTTAYPTLYTPYVSPWMEMYNDTLSSMTPYLEILRDGSSTAYQDDEVWAQFSYQGTSGVPIASFTDDRMDIGENGTPANQDSGMGTGSWTGEAGTAWSGKLVAPSSITPAEIGPLRARVCVGVASSIVYVDPTIRT